MRVSFYDVFSVSGGAISPRTRVKIGGVQMGPGVSFGAGVIFSGVNLANLVGHDLEVENRGTFIEIVGHY